MLAAIAFLPAAVSVAAATNAPEKVEVEAGAILPKSSSRACAIRPRGSGSRASTWSWVSGQDPEQVGELVDNLERLDYLLRLYMTDS
jgi:hypothetical protein